MKVSCYLRGIRGERTLRQIAEASGVHAAELSRIETGIALPRDKDIDALESAYGAEVVNWYPPRVLLALQGDDERPRSLYGVDIDRYIR